MKTPARRVTSFAAFLALSLASSTGSALASTAVVPLPATTPTLSQFLNAANVEYEIGSGNPVGLSPFLVNGKQLSFTDTTNGVQSNVWKTADDQLIVAFQGTQDLQQFLEDLGVAATTVTTGEKESLTFVNSVVAYAKSVGISTSNVFLTGHSLGGIQAEYAAQQTGLAGVAFESTGIPLSSNAGKGTNFIDIVTYGDPIGSYSSDINAMQPIAPPYVKGGGTLPHYGVLIEIGNPADQASLKTNFSFANILYFLPAALEFHLIGVQAHDTDVTLSPFTWLFDAFGNFSAQSVNAGSLTIPQIIADLQ